MAAAGSGREVKMGGRQCWEWEGGEDGREAMLGGGLCWETGGGGRGRWEGGGARQRECWRKWEKRRKLYLKKGVNILSIKNN